MNSEHSFYSYTAHFMYKTSWKKWLQFSVHSECFKPLRTQLQKKKIKETAFCSEWTLQLISKDLSFSNILAVHSMKENPSLGRNLMEILLELYKKGQVLGHINVYFFKVSRSIQTGAMQGFRNCLLEHPSYKERQSWIVQSEQSILNIRKKLYYCYSGQKGEAVESLCPWRCWKSDWEWPWASSWRCPCSRWCPRCLLSACGVWFKDSVLVLVLWRKAGFEFSAIFSMNVTQNRCWANY